MMSIDLKQHVNFPMPEWFDEKVNSIVIQPLSILLVQDSKIGFFKLTTNTFANATSLCRAEQGSRLTQVTFADKSPGLLFAVSQP